MVLNFQCQRDINDLPVLLRCGMQGTYLECFDCRFYAEGGYLPNYPVPAIPSLIEFDGEGTITLFEWHGKLCGDDLFVAAEWYDEMRFY